MRMLAVIGTALLLSSTVPAYADTPAAPAQAASAAPAPTAWKGFNWKLVNGFAAPASPLEGAVVTLWNATTGKAALLAMAGPNIKFPGGQFSIRAGFVDNLGGQDGGLIEVAAAYSQGAFGLFAFSDVYPGLRPFQTAHYMALDWLAPYNVSLGGQAEGGAIPVYGMIGPHLGLRNLPCVGPVKPYAELQYLLGGMVGTGVVHKTRLIMIFSWNGCKKM